MVWTVRLVRACGSKRLNYYFWIRRDYGQARKSLWIETIFVDEEEERQQGQARKSLWIETPWQGISIFVYNGQARKSLWIETTLILIAFQISAVRLVRACGSKLLKTLW